MSDALITQRRGAVLIMTINRPEAKNALNGAVAAGLADALDELDNSDTLHVGVLTGAGGTFSAGMDLKAFLKGESVVVGDRGLAGLTRRPPRKPLIAAVEGWALAGGFEMLLACDLVVASETARFGVPEVKRALVAGAGASLLLTQRIPYVAAMEILLTGEAFDATRARELGLLNRVVPEGDALEAAVELATRIAANGPYAVAVTKEIAKSARDWTAEEMWDKQDEIMLPVFASEDAKEGALAFAEKRTPQWTGR